MYRSETAEMDLAAKSRKGPSLTTSWDVLVVDDDTDIREVIGETLEDAGYRVRSAANGREALSELDDVVTENDEDRPCLILLDMMMPEMNGWEFLDRRSRDPRLHDIPVVVVSASAVAPEHAEGFMRKPVDLDGLLETVERHCPSRA